VGGLVVDAQAQELKIISRVLSAMMAAIGYSDIEDNTPCLKQKDSKL